jgi:acetyl esterase/lipase
MADLTTMANPDVAEPSGGLVHAVVSLLTPPHFTPRQPVASALPYRESWPRGIAPLAEVYLPDGPGPHPSVVLVHGGGFLIGSKTMKPMLYLAKKWAEAGFAVMVFDYRMIFRGGRIEAVVDDVATAITWWSEQTERFNLQPDRINLMGLSAGATSMLLAGSRLPAGLVDRMVSVFGVYDFTYLNGQLTKLLRRWLFQSMDRSVWLRWSPVETARMPNPVLLVHGTVDDLVPIGHAARLAAMRTELGLPVETVVIEGARHGFFNEARTQHHADQAVDAAIAFLRQPSPVGARA